LFYFASEIKLMFDVRWNNTLPLSSFSSPFWILLEIRMMEVVTKQTNQQRAFYSLYGRNLHALWCFSWIELTTIVEIVKLCRSDVPIWFAVVCGRYHLKYCCYYPAAPWVMFRLLGGDRSPTFYSSRRGPPAILALLACTVVPKMCQKCASRMLGAQLTRILKKLNTVSPH